MRTSLALAPVAPLGCKDCAFLEMCGGLEGQQAMYGCFSKCGPCGIERDTCDYSCPRKPDFWRDWVEVGGFNPKQRRPLTGLDLTLDQYIPMIRHRSSRQEPLPNALVALNAFEVMDSTCHARDASPEALRERFLLHPEAAILVVSVNHDHHVEGFWARRDPERLAALQRLGVAAMTTPNFSLFDDAPRLHSVRNIWRILRCAEDLADAGITPIPHVNAVSTEDWKLWGRLLRDNPAVRHVCKEFQTGLLDPTRAAAAVEGLRRLQDEVGRSLHPIIVGGRRVAHDLAAHFGSLTVVDSVPFLATLKRQRIVIDRTTARQIENPTKPNESLDALLQDNLRTYSRFVGVCVGSRSVAPSELDQFETDAGQATIFARAGLGTPT